MLVAVRSACQTALAHKPCAWHATQVFKPAAVPAAALLALSPLTPSWWDVFASSFLFLICMSQQFHAWSHMKKSELPGAVLALQVRASYPHWPCRCFYRGGGGRSSGSRARNPGTPPSPAPWGFESRWHTSQAPAPRPCADACNLRPPLLWAHRMRGC
jgi:hypothetical protein